MSRHILVAFVLASATTIGIAVSAGASTSARPQVQTLTLVAHPIGGGSVDNPPKGPSLGDTFYESSVLTDAAGHRRGTALLNGQLVAGNPAHGMELVATSASLPGGTLSALGGHATVDRFTLPVLGGTGRYLGTTGTLTISPAAHGTDRIVLKLERTR